jgi:hypothetical protein
MLAHRCVLFPAGQEAQTCLGDAVFQHTVANVSCYGITSEKSLLDV